MLYRVSVLGMGYVGLITGVVFSHHGFPTICTTTTLGKADNLNEGIPPFFEPSLEDYVKNLTKMRMLIGSVDNKNAIKKSNISFVCVGTPSLPDGCADLSAVKKTAEDIGFALMEKDEYHVVVMKSTVPPGTTENVLLPIIENISRKKVGYNFGLCMNPEFLREGEAIYDGFNPDRIVIGEYDNKSGDELEKIYKDFSCPIFRCDIKTAEIIKYASNSLLATKITFANEFARICENFNVDVYEVMKAVGLDFRINPRFLRAGVGFGGSCLPKDVLAISSLAREKGVETPLLDSILYTNELQPMHFVDLVSEKIGDLKEKTIAFYGLSFKPNTDDIRYSRAVPIIKELIKRGAKIKAYDPMAVNNFKKNINIKIDYKNDVKSLLLDSDFLVIQTEWDEIKEYDIDKIKKYLKYPIIFDGRKTFNPHEIVEHGIKYYSIGWKNNY